MSSPVEEIKSRLDLAEFIQSYVRLQKAGINYKALCPFHSEKTPSFFVSPSRQIWHCFGGCGKGGDIFKFVMEIEGLDFPEALRMLAQRAGVVLKREDPALRSEKNRLYDICEEAAKIFEKNLSLTPAARTYLKKRGVGDETIKKFRIGFAPQSWDFLLRALSAKGFKKEEIEKSGLVVKSEDGASVYDRFRSRIIFPITDTNERVIGFGGRVFAPQTNTDRTQTVAENFPRNSASGPRDSSAGAKYVNTPNTLIYDKSRALYGFDQAKQEIREKNQVVVVEGYMDCIMSHQAGVKNTIAVSGTALTPQQLLVLRRIAEAVVSSFDTDAAGDTATKKSLALAAQFDFERKIAVIPAGKDPADAAAENPKLWIDAVAGAKPAVEFYFEKAFRDYNPLVPEGKKAIAALLLPFISELKNEIEKAHWIGELSRKLGVGESAVWGELKRHQGLTPAAAAVWEKEKSSVPLRRHLLEERVLVLLPLLKEEIRLRELKRHFLTFTVPTHKEIFNVLQNGVPGEENVSLRGELEILRFKGEVLSEITEDLEQDFLACKRELEKESLREKLLALGQEIEIKEKAGDQNGVAVLLQDFRELSQELREVAAG